VSKNLPGDLLAEVDPESPIHPYPPGRVGGMSEDSGPCPFPFEVPAEQVDDLLVGNFWELTALEGHFELPGDRAGPESVSVKKHPPGPQGPAGGDCVVRPRGQDDGPHPFCLECDYHHILMPQKPRFYGWAN